MRGLCLLVLAAARAARGGAVRRAAPSSTSRSTRSTQISAGGLRRLAVRRPRAGRGPGDPARRVLALGAAARGRRRRARRARSPGGCTRSRPRARCSGRCSRRCVLIPLLGTQRTFLVFALALALVAAAGLGLALRGRPGGARGWRSRSRSGRSRRPTTGRGPLRGRDRRYQYARVVEQPDGDRVLELNEGQAVALALPARAAT